MTHIDKDPCLLSSAQGQCSCSSCQAEEIKILRQLKDKAEANYRFMVEKACDEKLEGDRELGRKLAATEEKVDELRSLIIRFLNQGGLQTDAFITLHKQAEKVIYGSASPMTVKEKIRNG